MMDRLDKNLEMNCNRNRIGRGPRNIRNHTWKLPSFKQNQQDI